MYTLTSIYTKYIIYTHDDYMKKHWKQNIYWIYICTLSSPQRSVCLGYTNSKISCLHNRMHS